MTTTHDLAIEAAGLTKRFGATQALDGVDLAAPRGTVLGVLGPNGAGKTTAVRILATLLRPDGGTARVAGHDVVARPRGRPPPDRPHRPVRVRRRDLTGTQNLVMIGRLLDLSRATRRRARPSCSTGSTSTDAADRPAKTYSGGMRRRLDLAASLVGRPAVVFLDEPTTGLDPAKRDDMWDVVRGLVARRLHRPAHDAVPRGGRRAGRRHHRLRPRPRHRPRHARRAQARSSAARRSGAPRRPRARSTCRRPIVGGHRHARRDHGARHRHRAVARRRRRSPRSSPASTAPGSR